MDVLKNDVSEFVILADPWMGTGREGNAHSVLFGCAACFVHLETLNLDLLQVDSLLFLVIARCISRVGTIKN